MLRKQGLKEIERTLCGKGGGGGGLRTFFFSLMCIILRSGGSRGGAGWGPAPCLFFDQNEARRAEKIFLETVPPPPLPYLSVWMTAPPPLIWRSGSATATQQNNFQNICSAETNLLPPVQCCFLQTPKDQAFFRRHATLLPVVGGRKESQWLGCLEKSSLSVQFNQEFCPRL